MSIKADKFILRDHGTTKKLQISSLGVEVQIKTGIKKGWVEYIIQLVHIAPDNI